MAKKLLSKHGLGFQKSFPKDKKKLLSILQAQKLTGDPYHDIDQYKQKPFTVFLQPKGQKKGQFNFTYNITYGRGFYENYKQGQNLSDYKIYP